MTQGNEPAYPIIKYWLDELGGQHSELFAEGLTKREHAAIELGIPDSGTEWLDDMIRKAQLRDLAGLAMQGLLANGIVNEYKATGPDDNAILSLANADALLAELAKDDVCNCKVPFPLVDGHEKGCPAEVPKEGE